LSEFFGEVISKYTLEDAIEDGLHADFGYVEAPFGRVRIVATTNFMANVNTYQLMHVVLKTLRAIRPLKPNWVVFDNEITEEHMEDEGRTLRAHIDGLDKKVYAILDNHSDHYTLTLLLAEDY